LKGHVAIDPDSEVITATAVTAGNTGDAASTADLLAQDLPAMDPPTQDVAGDGGGPADQANTEAGHQDAADNETESGEVEAPLAVYGDAAYGAGVLLERLEAAGADILTKVQPPVAPGGRFPKDAFTIDLGAGTVTCPAHVTVPIRAAKAGGGTAAFAGACAGCPLAAQCTTAKTGRTDQYRRLRRRVDPGPGHPAGPGVAGRIPGHQTKGRAETRALDAPPARRQAGTCPRSDQGWR